MDLAAESTRLRLDLLAVTLGSALDMAGVPYALLKGPSTSLWLYDPPRRYNDVDLLVPLSQAHRARDALETAGLATARSGGVGEEASHSLLMHSSEGFEVDLHVSLPITPSDRDRVWTALAEHRESLDLGIGTVTALDEPARCLVLALHALSNPAASQASEDLARARVTATPESWRSAQHLATGLEIRDLIDACLAMSDGRVIPMSRRARLHVQGASPVALGVQRLIDSPRRDLPRLLWRETFPSRGFMARAYADPDLHGCALARAHLDRWRRLVRQVVIIVRTRRGH